MTALFVGSCDYASDDLGGGERPEDKSSQEGELNRSINTINSTLATE
jgi:hypothetical protein